MPLWNMQQSSTNLVGVFQSRHKCVKVWEAQASMSVMLQTGEQETLEEKEMQNMLINKVSQNASYAVSYA